MLKKRHSANNYHRICEAVAAKIVSIIFCPTKYNLADMGTKPLNGMIHQFLLKNQTFPPAEKVGEYERDSKESADGSTVWQTKYATQVLSPLDREIIQSCLDQNFLLTLRRTYIQETF